VYQPLYDPKGLVIFDQPYIADSACFPEITYSVVGDDRSACYELAAPACSGVSAGDLLLGRWDWPLAACWHSVWCMPGRPHIVVQLA
jgi:hypothetical protein